MSTFCPLTSICASKVALACLAVSSSTSAPSQPCEQGSALHCLHKVCGGCTDREGQHTGMVAQWHTTRPMVVKLVVAGSRAGTGRDSMPCASAASVHQLAAEEAAYLAIGAADGDGKGVCASGRAEAAGQHSQRASNDPGAHGVKARARTRWLLLLLAPYSSTLRRLERCQERQTLQQQYHRRSHLRWAAQSSSACPFQRHNMGNLNCTTYYS